MASPADYYQQQQQQRQYHNHHPFQQQQSQHHHNLPPAPPPHHDRAPRTIPEEQAPYGHHYQEPPSPSKRRTFSFHSDKSQPRKAPVVKAADLHETHAEKEAKRLHSKADPTLAMNEAEPSAVATMKTEIIVAPLRSLQHKDALGNVIAEPDKSNPTRHRWERPLDTIRSFEAAIDGGYSRKSMYRADTDSVMLNRRSSYHPGQHSRDSHYGSRPVSIRPEYSGHGRNSYYEGQGFNGGYGPPPGRHPRASRQYSEPQFHSNGRDSAVYPLPHKDRSYETVTSAAGSGHSDPAGYHTDPTSSDNSSIDRVAPPKRQEPTNDYGIGFNQSQSFSVGMPGKQSHPLPPPPQEAAYGHAAPAAQRKMVKRQPTVAQTETPTPAADKRKSWFSRRFSKNS